MALELRVEENKMNIDSTFVDETPAQVEAVVGRRREVGAARPALAAMAAAEHVEKTVTELLVHETVGDGIGARRQIGQ